jgi:hypothetical protein
MPKNIVGLALIGAVFFFAVQPQAQAACFYPRAVTITYSAFVDDTPAYAGTLWACSEIIISPMHPHHWDVIGQSIRDCDGSYSSSWGDTTSCTGSENKETTSESCPPVCE